VTEASHVRIESDADTVVARQAGRDVALSLGFTRTEAIFVATAISEIARNITVHARSGEIILRELDDDGRRGLEVIARDDGPGIEDVETVMRQDYESNAGLGMGIWGAMRLMDDVHIESRPGEGTTVTMRKWRNIDEVAAFLDGQDKRTSREEKVVRGPG
jgi:serine/threonine-protein kinase RsbT